LDELLHVACGEDEDTYPGEECALHFFGDQFCTGYRLVGGSYLLPIKPLLVQAKVWASFLFEERMAMYS
jgi:hypothetical protein